MKSVKKLKVNIPSFEEDKKRERERRRHCETDHK